MWYHPVFKYWQLIKRKVLNLRDQKPFYGLELFHYNAFVNYGLETLSKISLRQGKGYYGKADCIRRQMEQQIHGRHMAHEIVNKCGVTGV